MTENSQNELIFYLVGNVSKTLLNKAVKSTR